MREYKPVFAWNPELYNPDVLKATGFISEKEQRKEYRHLRSVALKRLKSFEGTDLVNTDTYKYYREAFATPAGRLSAADLPYALTDAAKFLQSKLSTRTRMERSMSKTINTLHSHGYDFVNRENFLAFTDFMEQWRSESIGRLYASDRVAELYNETRRLGLNQDEVFANFNEYLSNLENLKRIPKNAGPKGTSSEYVKQKLGI